MNGTTVGSIDQDGVFKLKTTFDTRSPSDMEAMMRLLNEEEANPQVEEYGPKVVVVSYRPDNLSG